MESSTFGYDREFPELDDRDPTERPDKYLRRRDGTDELEVVDGRRPSRMLLVNRLRAAVDGWRDKGYAGASATTRELFHHWFSDGIVGSDDQPFAPYWGQREAVETLAFLIEVEKMRDVQRLIETYAEVRQATSPPERVTFYTEKGARYARIPKDNGGHGDVRLPPESLPRYACKMATGSGKTLVMALVIVWSYFHARREPGSPLSTNFLVLAPNVIVFERLRVDFEHGRIFQDPNRPLVPPGWNFDLQVILRGESTEPGGAGNLFLTNIQQLYEGPSEGAPPANPVQALLGPKPAGNVATQGRSMLDRVRSLDRLLVCNDEAHHVHDDNLEWNKTLLDLHKFLPDGLAAWLDFSATPRFQDGAHFPWIVCDYPLAQAVEDRIVKAPVILHRDAPDPERVTRQNVTEKYRDWLIAGVDRLKAHTDAFKGVPGAKPVMFVMCESVQHADRVGAWFKGSSSPFQFNDDEVLVIHTDNKTGEVKKSELDELRRKAREIDDPANPIKVVVSVLVLREGWDVRNVTIVLGLRPGTAEARILPEQAVGRGLRLMSQVSGDRRQVLEVLGTPAFENFVRELEAEGVYIPTTATAPLLPFTIHPVEDRAQFDIEIPRSGLTLLRTNRHIDAFDPSQVDPLFALSDTADGTIPIDVEDATYGIELGHIHIKLPKGPLVTELVGSIVKKIEKEAKLTNAFAQLYPIVKLYLSQRCFGTPVDLEAENIRRFLADSAVQDRVAALLGRALGELDVERQRVAIERDPIRLSQTPPFPWRRHHEPMNKTIFNEVATFNPFETSFARFLADNCEDVLRFAALRERKTSFWVNYLKPSGGIGYYYPDWVVVQQTPGDEVNWIVETKGRVWEGTEQKDAAINYWCREVSQLTGRPWRYMRVDQAVFEPDALQSYAALVSLVTEQNASMR